MTNFNESKLSRIIARRLIVPEDKSQMLPFSTPIFCPDYNGVRASRVTIINPNTNSFYTDDSLPGTVGLGGKLSKNAAALNPLVETNGTITVSNTGVVSGFSADNYISINNANTIGLESFHISGTIPRTFEDPINIVSATYGSNIEAIQVTPKGNIKLTKNGAITKLYDIAAFGTTFTLDYKVNDNKIDVTIKNLKADGTDLKATFLPDAAVTLITFGISSDARYTIDTSKSYFTLSSDKDKKVPFFTSGRVASKENVSNTVNIDMTIPVSRTYFVPHEVDLESDVNLQEMIKSDFAVAFKKAVSDEILKQIKDASTAGTIQSLTASADTANTIGTVISDYILNGTGQKYSIYSYNNGAPVTYSTSSNQPEYDKMVLKDSNSDFEYTLQRYASKDDVDVPAMYFIEQPTLLLDATNFTKFQQGLCSGDVKDYANKVLSVQTTKQSFDIGDALGIFGTNDSFAVAFTEAEIKTQPDKDFYANNINITVYFGVKLVNDVNMKVINPGS